MHFTSHYCMHIQFFEYLLYIRHFENDLEGCDIVFQ